MMPQQQGGQMGGGGQMNLQALLQALMPILGPMLRQRMSGQGGGFAFPQLGAMGGGQLPPPTMGQMPQQMAPQQQYAPGRSPQDIEAASRYMAANPTQFGGLDLGGMDPQTLYQRAYYMQSHPMLFQNQNGQMSQVGQPIQPPMQGPAGMPGMTGTPGYGQMSFQPFQAPLQSISGFGGSGSLGDFLGGANQPQEGTMMPNLNPPNKGLETMPGDIGTLRPGSEMA